jgi:dTDP-4-dehydrorhamnose reductase
MKILIFGSGSKTAHSLFNEFSNNKDNEFFWYSGKNKPEWFIGDNWFIGDFGDDDFIKSSIDTVKPDYVINLCAITDVDACEDNKEETILINYLIPKLLSELSSKYEFNFIHISTDYVFNGNSGPYEISEILPDESLGIYAMTKKDSEKHVIENNGCIIRTNMLYGSENHNDFFSWLKTQIDNKSVPVVTNEQYSNPTLIKDLAKVISICVEKNLKGIIHTGGKDWGSRWEFAQVLAISLGLDPSSNIMIMANSKGLNQKAVRPKFAGLSIEISENILDYTFSGFYDYVLEKSTILKTKDGQDNPEWLIFEKLLKILRVIPNDLRKNSVLDIQKNEHGTISLYISTEKLWSEIEIGKTTLSGVIYRINGEDNFDLLNGDLFQIEEIDKFILELNDFVLM